MASKLPASHSLKDIGQWYIQRLDARKQLLEAVRIASNEGRPLRVGTMCSGTDSPVAVLTGLKKALGGKMHVEHTFSCEFDSKKRDWITANFPKLKILFGDVMELKTGKAMNYITNTKIDVPQVDIVIAGFVCKSVSTENNEREKYKNCINEACGKTGETFDGVMGYVQKYRPSIVVCENVKGLTTRNKGAEPVINHVKASFNKVDYAFEHEVLDTRDYLLPHRRNRCWMWAFEGRQNQEAVEQTAQDVKSLQSKAGFSFGQLFKMAGVSRAMPRQLNRRERRVVRMALRKTKPADRQKDIMIDIAKSEARAPKCIGAASCIVPNSLPYRLRTGSIFTPEQVHCLQGIYKEDFPALAKYAKEKKALTRDLAGNAFSTTVCMAVLISCLMHAPLSDGMPAPATPPRKSRALSDLSPPRTRAKRSIEEVAMTPPSKRVRRMGA